MSFLDRFLFDRLDRQHIKVEQKRQKHVAQIYAARRNVSKIVLESARGILHLSSHMEVSRHKTIKQLGGCDFVAFDFYVHVGNILDIDIPVEQIDIHGENDTIGDIISMVEGLVQELNPPRTALSIR